MAGSSASASSSPIAHIGGCAASSAASTCARARAWCCGPGGASTRRSCASPSTPSSSTPIRSSSGSSTRSARGAPCRAAARARSSRWPQASAGAAVSRSATAWRGHRAAPPTRASSAARGEFDDEDDEPRARVLVASRDPRFLRLARFLLGGRDLEVEELTHARATSGGDPRAERRPRRPRRRRRGRGSTAHGERDAGAASGDTRSSSRRTPAERARPAFACSTAGTRPRSCCSTSSVGSRSASREPRHPGGECDGRRTQER